MSATKQVVLAAEYTDEDDKRHKADSEIELPRAEANRLLFAGLARLPKAPEPVKSDRVEDVLAEVGDDPEKAAAALAAERDGKNRTTLVSKLESISNPEGKLT
jgi:hypothetical protein